MADDPKIIPDAPPAEPVSVRVDPDPAPWTPHDVQVSFDGPPWNPIDVPLYPDGDPWSPHDVQVDPDGPPRQPFDVHTLLDGPPAVPVDVPVFADPPPWDPTDVQVVADAPPSAPFDVPLVTDPSPWVPVDVQTTPSAPPAQPVDVQISPDVPGPLSGPLEVRDHRFPPPPHVPPPGRTPQEMADALRRYDSQLASFLDHVGEVLPFVSAAGRGALDPLILADWLRNYERSVGVGGMARFIEQQSMLYAMNPVVARIFDPSYFAKLAVPGLTGEFNTTIDPVTIQEIVQAEDDILVSQVGSTPGPAPGQIRLNVFDARSTAASSQDFTVDDMVDARTENPPRPSRFMTESPEVRGVARFDASKYFDQRDSHGAQNIRGTVKTLVSSGQGPSLGESKMAKAAATHGIIRVGVPGEGEPLPGSTTAYDGVIMSRTPSVENLDEDDVRLPLWFTDLRKDPSADAYRTVCFQPMNLVFSKGFSPQYNETNAFGRVDQMVGYIGTSEQWNLSFDVHAFVPEDLVVMYNKMTWLTSMVYPTYGNDAIMRSGPVTRMRIGDVAATSEGGLPGIIRNLNFDFAECIWELKKGLKVPRSFSVQVDYLVLHDGPVGLLDGLFGVLQIPGSDQRANLAGQGPTNPSTEPRDNGLPQVTTLATGRWARFGEPTRKG